MKIRTAFSKIPFFHLIIMLPLACIISMTLLIVLENFLPSNNSFSYLFAIVGNYVFKIFLVIYLTIFIEKKVFISDFILNDECSLITLRKSISDIVLLFILVQIMNLTNTLLVSYFDLHNPLGIRILNSSQESAHQPPLILTMLLSIGTMAIAPITEEIVYRGWILNRLLVNKNTISSILISSILFSFGHGPGRFFASFMIGFILAIIYLKYQNIGVPIFFHIIHNSFLIIGSTDRVGLNELIDWFTSFLINPNTKNPTLLLSVIFYLVSIIGLIGFIKKNWPRGDQVKFLDTNKTRYEK